MQGNKTHEQQRRILERKLDMPDGNQTMGRPQGGVAPPVDLGGRDREFQGSSGGPNQENRDHNKHNNPGQSGHKPQQHRPAEEKH
jgi:hypothetical protein